MPSLPRGRPEPQFSLQTQRRKDTVFRLVHFRDSAFIYEKCWLRVWQKGKTVMDITAHQKIKTWRLIKSSENTHTHAGSIHSMYVFIVPSGVLYCKTSSDDLCLRCALWSESLSVIHKWCHSIAWALRRLAHRLLTVEWLHATIRSANRNLCLHTL